MINQLTKYTNVSELINTNISENVNRQNTNASVIYRHKQKQQQPRNPKDSHKLKAIS